MAYRIAPYTKEETQLPTQTSTSTAAAPQNDDMSERLSKLEQAIKNLTDSGGKFNGLL